MLEKITHCSQIQSYSVRELKKLAYDCRKKILEATSKSGGHLASSLGAVELTVALANVFDFERDKIIWDVGHQAYAYKLLTGRAHLLDKLGQKGGISKFLSLSESKYDYFGAGHASTSISAALGLSKAAELNGEGYKTVAVIGDGAMTGGLAYEALNHAGHLKRDLLVILNDNEMSIDPNVGALSKTMLNISSSQSFNLFRAEMIKQVRENKLPLGLRKTLDRLNDSLMAFFTKGIWFEKFEFRYFGQIDAHNIKKLVSILNLVKHLKGPILLHTITQKGKGYSFAEKNPTKYHGVGPFNLKTGQLVKISPPKGKSYTSIWSKSFARIMESDPKVVGVSAAMLANTGLLPLQKKYPDRIFDVGIAEGHAVTFAGGLAAQGIKPFVVIYSTFLQRAFDHVVHDIARQKLAVRFILDRGGFVGADGATHHGVLDLSYLRMIPGMVIMAPKDGAETQAMLNTAHNYQEGPIALRFPRHVTANYYDRPQKEIGEIPIGKGESLRSGDDILLIAAGTMAAVAQKAAEKLEKEGISVGVINARFVKPLDEELIMEEISKVKLAATLEENAKTGGFGCGVLELLAEKQILKPLVQFGVPDRFIKFASRSEQLKESGLDVDSVSEKLKDVWNNLFCEGVKSRIISPLYDRSSLETKRTNAV